MPADADTAPAAAPAQASDSGEEYDFVHVVLDSDDEPDAGPSSNSDCQIVGGRTLEERNAELLEKAIDLADDESPSRGWLAAGAAASSSQASSAASLIAVCHACGGAEPARNNDIVICEAVSNDGPCGRAYHQRCLAPPLRTIPTDAWHCPRCVEARRAGSWRGAAGVATLEVGRRRIAACARHRARLAHGRAPQHQKSRQNSNAAPAQVACRQCGGSTIAG